MTNNFIEIPFYKTTQEVVDWMLHRAKLEHMEGEVLMTYEENLARNLQDGEEYTVDLAFLLANEALYEWDC